VSRKKSVVQTNGIAGMRRAGNVKRVVALVLALLVTLTACSVEPTNTGGAAQGSSTSCDKSGAAPGITDDSITLGATMPLTGSAAVGGKGAADGEQAYFDRINQQGGVKGRKIEFIALDDEYTPAVAQQRMRELVLRENVFAVAGGEGTPNFLAVVDFLEQQQVPAIAPYAPSSKVGTMATPYVWMANLNYIQEFEIMTRYVLEKDSPKSLALVGVSGNVGDDAEAGMKKGIGDKDIKLKYIPEEPGTSDFTPIASTLKQFDADYTFLILTNTDTGQLLKAMLRVGYEPKTAAWPGMSDQSYIDAFGDVSQGMLVAEETANLDSKDPRVQTFVRQFEEQTGHAPTKFNELGWAQGQITVEALRSAPALTRDCLAYALNNMKNFETGIYPPLTFAPKDRQGGEALGLARIEGNELVEVAPFQALEE
jgi:branched-chain amino acid transport system substrate-binding protein